MLTNNTASGKRALIDQRSEFANGMNIKEAKKQISNTLRAYLKRDELGNYLIPTVREMIGIGQTYGAVWYSVGARSKKGHPHHPLYLRKDEKLKPFDVNSYLDSI